MTVARYVDTARSPNRTYWKLETLRTYSSSERNANRSPQVTNLYATALRVKATYETFASNLARKAHGKYHKAGIKGLSHR